MRIAVGTDFSEQAQRLRAVATALARKLGASLTLIHVVEPFPTTAQAVQLADEARHRLDPVVGEMRKQGFTVDLEVVRGYADESIASAAKRIGADVLLMGTHGRRAPLRWFLGSVAERTLQSSELPVLVVGDGADSFLAWADGKRRLRVTFALESASPAEPLLEVARLFHRAGTCELRFVHVASRALLAGRLPMLLERAFHGTLVEFGAHLQVVPDGESLGITIAAVLSEHPCDLVVVGIHPRWEFEFPRTAELARSLLHHRVGPVLGVPLAAPTATRDSTPRFASILAPTDLSELGNHAIRYAYALTQSGAVTILYVYQTPGGIVAPLDDPTRAQIEVQLQALVPRDAEARGITTSIVVVDGAHPAQAIVDTATRLSSDVICMGSHGRSTLGRVLLGSVAEEVLHRFPKPVFVIR